MMNHCWKTVNSNLPRAPNWGANCSLLPCPRLGVLQEREVSRSYRDKERRQSLETYSTNWWQADRLSPHKEQIKTVGLMQATRPTTIFPLYRRTMWKKAACKPISPGTRSFQRMISTKRWLYLSSCLTLRTITLWGSLQWETSSSRMEVTSANSRMETMTRIQSMASTVPSRWRETTMTTRMVSIVELKTLVSWNASAGEKSS